MENKDSEQIIIEGNIRYRILKYKDKNYILDTCSNPLGQLLPFFTSFIYNKAYKVDEGTITSFSNKTQKENTLSNTDLLRLIPVVFILSKIFKSIDQSIRYYGTFDMRLLITLMIVSIAFFFHYKKKEKRKKLLNNLFNLSNAEVVEIRNVSKQKRSTFKLLTLATFLHTIITFIFTLGIYSAVTDYIGISSLTLIAVGLAYYTVGKQLYMSDENFKIIEKSPHQNA
ncbi:DUF443 family protein [Mammaliicoccus stepanovicii]|uniref:Tandem five-TM protein n=1 Tax=Mammaliicoccus stepanovicii TaxID=643214 RepID=A0A239ZCT9_9STAP|nr:DUF443 family protein [Mammaliicoccus stepanovicii]PNZ71594.1 DUF443 domain-containing protein [Mammaliicoccus stepanovicii]GGI42052.1 hypothetical protein GCM10010896_16490 [Mammaliicoccus stepanovicii]SNV68660.1 tandem five-TM protein [Mammaliicoccus stepanovicii]